MEHSTLIPRSELKRVADAQHRFAAAINGLTDRVARRSTALPGWTVAHVLTHVARNADSHRRRAEAAALGEMVEQYPGGYFARAEEIEIGARRSAAELINDVCVSGERLESTWLGMPDSAWASPTRDVANRERPLSALPSRRWQELEVHVVDLGLGITHRDWSDDFMSVWLPRLRAFHGRLAEHASSQTTLDEKDELAWLYGRLRLEDLPILAPWE